jgi:hypothetical protein
MSSDTMIAEPPAVRFETGRWLRARRPETEGTRRPVRWIFSRPPARARGRR